MALAIQSSQSESTSTLLKYMQAKKIRAPYDTYLLLATQYNLPAIAAQLAPQSKKPATDSSGRNPLWFAAKNADSATISLLLKAGMPAKATDLQGKTPFYVAVDADCLSCVDLLAKYIDINQQTISGNSALMTASRKGNKEMVSWLLENGADPELRNAQGDTALIASVQANSIELARLLSAAGANASRKNKLGFSALDLAKDQNKEIYELLKGRSVLDIF